MKHFSATKLNVTLFSELPFSLITLVWLLLEIRKALAKLLREKKKHFRQERNFVFESLDGTTVAFEGNSEFECSEVLL